MGMFDFLLMGNDYEERKVARLDAEWGFISTARVNDAQQPYETAIKHPNYYGGEIVIVETYDSRIEAEQGHAHWVGVMTADGLPERLVDRGSSGISQLLDVFSDDNEWRIMERKP